MPKPDFYIDVSDQSVSVRLDASGKSPRGRFYFCMFNMAFVALAICGASLKVIQNTGHYTKLVTTNIARTIKINASESIAIHSLGFLSALAKCPPHASP